MKIGELFVQLGVKADTITVRDFGRAVADLPLAAAGAIVSLTGLSVGFVELTKHALDMSNNLSLFRAETGLSVEELQRWQAVAKQVGLSGDVVTNSVMRLANALAQMRLGHYDQGFLMALGQIGVGFKGKNAFQLLQDIMAKTRTMNPQVASSLLANLGLSAELMKMPVPGSSQFNQMARGNVVMTSREMQAMQDFQKAIAQFTLTIEKSFVPVITAFEPYMKDLTEVMSAILAKAGGFVGHTVGETAKFLNAIRKQGGFSSFMENLANSMLTPEMTRKNVNNVTVNQTVHSSADAEEVARIAGHTVTRGMTHAMKQFNNGGY